MSATKEKLRASVAEFIGKKPAELADDAALTGLVADSFTLVELVMTLQEDYGVRLVQEDLQHVANVGQLLTLFAERVDKKG